MSLYVVFELMDTPLATIPRRTMPTSAMVELTATRGDQSMEGNDIQREEKLMETYDGDPTQCNSNNRGQESMGTYADNPARARPTSA